MLNFAKILLAFACLSIGCTNLSAQKSEWVVEVGAYASKVQAGYFKTLEGVYETLDGNDIFRYYIDAKDEKSAQTIRETAKQAGFVNARVIDFEKIRQQCEAQCGFVPPRPTDANLSLKTLPKPPIDPLKVDNPALAAKPKNGKSKPPKPETNNEPIAATLEKQPKNITPADKNKPSKIANPNPKNSNPKSAKVVQPEPLPASKPEPIATSKPEPTTASKPNPDANNRIEWLFFDFDQYALRDRSKTELQEAAELLKANPTYKIHIFAHTDAKGKDDYNVKLSKNRAEAARKYLKTQGIRDKQILVCAFGEQKHLAKNERKGTDTPEGRQFNRRVELEIVDKNGKVLPLVDTTFVPDDLKY
jgi:outer membrane protein OmpA-like peptidoglycan-associated protein